MNYPGNLAQDCAAVAKPAHETLPRKFLKALDQCLEDGAVYFDGDEYLFTLDGGHQAFIDALMPTLNDAEAVEFITEYVVTDNAGWLCMARSLTDATQNAGRLALAAAEKILWGEDSQNYLSEKAKRDAEFFGHMQRSINQGRAA